MYIYIYIEDLIICLVALIDFALRLDVRCAWVAVRSITLTARPYRPAKLDCPDPSDLPLRGHAAPVGRDFSAQVAPTWVPGPSKHSIPWGSGVDIRKSSFSHKVAEDLAKSLKKACQVTAEPAK